MRTDVVEVRRTRPGQYAGLCAMNGCPRDDGFLINLGGHEVAVCYGHGADLEALLAEGRRRKAAERRDSTPRSAAPVDRPSGPVTPRPPNALRGERP